MKGKIALLMATVMAAMSFSAVTMAASKNSVAGKIRDMNADEILIEYVDDRSIDVLNTQEGMDSIASGSPTSMQLIPTVGVESGSSIILTIENGKFDERLADILPFKFKTKNSEIGYEEIMEKYNNSVLNGDSPYWVLAKYIKNEGSNELPYGFNYINDTQIEVKLSPLSDDDANAKYSSATQGIACYNIALPITTEGSINGPVILNLDSNDSAITSGTYTVAQVSGSTDETEVTTDETITEVTTDEISTEVATDEAITEVTTDEDTETTTRRVSSGGGGGGGGGGSIIKETATTTATTTETTTEITTGETVSEATTEATTENNPEVRISIGSNNIVVDNRTYAMDTAPYIQSSSNSTLVPLRFVAVALTGGNVDSADTSDIVSWDSAAKQAVISKDGIKAVFRAGSNIVTVNGREMAMDYGVTAEIKDNRMFIPFRAMGEILGYGVEWDANTKTAIYGNGL